MAIITNVGRTRKTSTGNPQIKSATRNRLERSVTALNSDQGLERESKAFIARPFVLFGLPHHKLDRNEFTRQNGDMRISLVSKSEYGIPHGQDRLFPILICTAFAAVGMPENNIFCFRALQDVIDLFQLPNAGVSRLRVRDWFRRWSHTTIYCDRITHDGKRIVEDFSSHRLVNKYQLWSDDNNPNQHTLFQNLVQIDNEFADDMRVHPIPLRLDLVRALRQNSGALDLAKWLGYRSYGLVLKNRDQLVVPVMDRGGLIEQLGCDIAQPKHMRLAFKKWFSAIRTAWPRCPHELSSDGNFLIVRAERPRPMDLPKEFLKSVSRWEGEFPRQAVSGRRLLDSLVDNPEE